MATVGNLKVDLGLDSAAFDVGLKNAGKGMDTLAKRAAVMGAAIAAAVTAAAGAFTAIVLKTSEAANATGDMADMLGLNVEALQELRHAADRGGMSMNNFDVAMRRFIRRSAEAANGTGAAKGAFEELGIQLRTTDGRLKDSEALLAEVSDAMEGVQNPADKLRLAFQMFDTDGAKMVSVLAGGSEELERLREEARKLGIVLDEDTIRAAQHFHDNLDTLRKGAEAFANRLTAMALPAFVAITNAMINFSAHTGDVIGAMVNIARYAGVAVAALAGFYAPAVLAGIGSLVAALRTGVVGAIQAITAAMMANPLGLLIAGISAAVAAAFIFRDELKQIIGVDVIEVVTTAANRIIAVFEGAYNAVIDLWQNLPQAFSGIGKMAWNSLIDELQKPALTIETPWGSWASGGLNVSGARAELTAGETAALGSAFATFNSTVAEGKDYIGDWTAALFSSGRTASEVTSTIDDLGSSLGGGGAGGLAGATETAAQALQGLGDIGQQVTSKLADSFTDMFIAVLEGGKNLGDMIGSLLKDLARMFLHQGFQALLGLGGGGIGGLFSGIGKIFGFARGGTILPGGAGGIDSQLVMFRKSPNERVDITKPGQTLTAGGGPSKVEININVDGARGNMEIEQMVSQGVAQGMKAVERNFGGMMVDYQMRHG